MKIISKFIFELFTSPLGLPIDPLWEYLILALIGKLAFEIGWDVSPGGPFGSIIHFAARGLSFFVMWGGAYVLIAIVKWIIANPIMALIVVISIVVITALMVLTILHIKRTCKKNNNV